MTAENPDHRDILNRMAIVEADVRVLKERAENLEGRFIRWDAHFEQDRAERRQRQAENDARDAKMAHELALRRSTVDSSLVRNGEMIRQLTAAVAEGRSDQAEIAKTMRTISEEMVRYKTVMGIVAAIAAGVWSLLLFGLTFFKDAIHSLWAAIVDWPNVG